MDWGSFLPEVHLGRIVAVFCEPPPERAPVWNLRPAGAAPLLPLRCKTLHRPIPVVVYACPNPLSLRLII